jgi:predicted RNA-binding Zn ribbon-like protein
MRSSGEPQAEERGRGRRQDRQSGRGDEHQYERDGDGQDRAGARPGIAGVAERSEEEHEIGAWAARCRVPDVQCDARGSSVSSGLRFTAAADAIALLTDLSCLARVSRCPGRDCGWLFLNLSGRRRWCSMSACGSREKMRRAYRRSHHPNASANQ